MSEGGIIHEGRGRGRGDCGGGGGDWVLLHLVVPVVLVVVVGGDERVVLQLVTAGDSHVMDARRGYTIFG